MKILVFTSQIHQLSGAERLSYELVIDLNKYPDIHADLLVMVSKKNPGTQNLINELTNKGVRYVDFLGRTPNLNILEIVTSILKLRKILKHGKYDIIETSLQGPCILATIASYGLKTVHLTGIHSCYYKEDKKRFSDFIFYIFTKLNKRIKYYAISKQVAYQWSLYLKIELEKISVIYNIVSSKFFRPKIENIEIKNQLKVPVNSKILLFAGRLEKAKGYHTIVEAVIPILKSNNICVLFAGEKKELDLYNSVQLRINNLGLNDRLIFLGWRNDIYELLSITDILVHTPFMEGFGIILAEALALGVPIVASNVGGIPEVLENTDSIIIPPGDPKKLQSAILKILNRNIEEIEIQYKKDKKRADFFQVNRRTEEFIYLFNSMLN
jgi:glycosyltransferase involved in cell wall biosynthesis